MDRSSLSLQKISFSVSNLFTVILLTFVVLSSCVSIKTRQDKTQKAPEPEQKKSENTTVHEAMDNLNTAADVLAPTVLTPKPSVRVGLILSAGGARAWAHIGVLKEIHKAKWPVHAVGGAEWGAVVAAVYAHSYSVNEVEWELSKVRDLAQVESNSRMIFEKKSVADLKAPFVCPSLNIAKQTSYLLNRGQLAWLMPFCLAHPPLSEPYAQSVAAISDISAMAQHLRQTGANRIVLINVLAQSARHPFTNEPLSAENILWAQSAALMAKKINGVDDVILVELDSYALSDLEKRREMIAKGSQLGYNQVLKLSQRYGL